MSKLSKNVGLLIGGSLGLLTSWAVSAPGSPLKHRIPQARIRNIEVLPNVRLKRKEQTYHIHHWMYFGIFYGSLFLIRRPFAGKRFVNGFVLGVIAQGLSYKDRLSIK